MRHAVRFVSFANNNDIMQPATPGKFIVSGRARALDAFTLSLPPCRARTNDAHSLRQVWLGISVCIERERERERERMQVGGGGTHLCG